MIATNAKQIVDARMQGFRPDEMILVSLVGRISEPNHTVLADPENRYDWRWVRDLEICVYVAAGIKWRDAVRDIAGARPRYLALWDVDGKRGATVYLIPTADDITKPVSSWKYQLDFLSWLDCENQGYIQCK